MMSEVNEALWEGGQGGEGPFLEWVGGAPQARLATENEKVFFLPLILGFSLGFLGQGLQEAASRAQGQRPQGRGPGRSAECLHFVRLFGDFTCETLAFRKVF